MPPLNIYDAKSRSSPRSSAADASHVQSVHNDMYICTLGYVGTGQASGVLFVVRSSHHIVDVVQGWTYSWLAAGRWVIWWHDPWQDEAMTGMWRVMRWQERGLGCILYYTLYIGRYYIAGRLYMYIYIYLYVIMHVWWTGAQKMQWDKKKNYANEIIIKCIRRTRGLTMLFLYFKKSSVYRDRSHAVNKTILWYGIDLKVKILDVISLNELKLLWFCKW